MLQRNSRLRVRAISRFACCRRICHMVVVVHNDRRAALDRQARRSDAQREPHGELARRQCRLSDHQLTRRRVPAQHTPGVLLHHTQGSFEQRPPERFWSRAAAATSSSRPQAAAQRWRAIGRSSRTRGTQTYELGEATTAALASFGLAVLLIEGLLPGFWMIVGYGLNGGRLEDYLLPGATIGRLLSALAIGLVISCYASIRAYIALLKTT